jgi:hypothetical protein
MVVPGIFLKKRGGKDAVLKKGKIILVMGGFISVIVLGFISVTFADKSRL